MVSGVPQGTVLGPLLFLIYINDLPENIHSSVRLFADDCVLYKKISSIRDTMILQKDPETLSSWEHRWQMSFNLDKCYVLRIPSSRSPIIISYKLGNSILQETKQHSYLGVDIQNDLKWDTNINRITSSASKILGFIRRNLGRALWIPKNLLTSLVRPTLEYCSAVWDPHTSKLTQKVGKIQRRAARLVFNNYDWHTSVNQLIRKMDLDMLSTRREIARLCILHKAIGGRLALPVQNYLQPVQRQTRRSHSGSYIEYQSRLDCFKFSFVPRTTSDWNNLPPSISNITDSDQFKSAVTNYLQALDKNIRD